MKKGKYRFIIQRTTEILITVYDPASFAQGELDWKTKSEFAYIPGSDYLSAIALQVERDEMGGDLPGARAKIDADDLVIEKVRTCRHCGCTENDACSLSTGACSWVADDVCSNPFCVALETAQAEKEVAS